MQTAWAQPVLTPRNVALGGGGSTYITDYNANFYNPANLVIQDRIKSNDLGFLVVGTYFNGVQNFTDINEQRGNFADYIYAFTPGSYFISPSERAEIIEDNYPNGTTNSLHQTRGDVTLVGFKIKSNDRAFSFALRNRTSSSFETGLGWYTSLTEEIDGVETLDRTLIHRFQSLYDVSFGYAETFKFFTDMTPRLDEFTIGIAPKLVMAGSYQEAIWKNRYQEIGGQVVHSQDFRYSTTGNFATATRQYMADPSMAQEAITSNISNSLLDIYGYGAGLDIGFTYLITLGSDLSTISENVQRTQKSLRLSLSITDIGFVSYTDEGTSLSLRNDTSIVAGIPSVPSDNAFVGAPGQFIDYVDQFSAANPFETAQREDSKISVILPTSLHAGILFEVNRIKLMGDLSIGLTNNAFNSKKLVASAGIEIRPFKFWPLRAGTQLATELPKFFSFGTGIETRYFDLSVATQFLSRTFSSSPTISGATVAAFQFHF